MILRNCFGRPLNIWLLYKKLPILIGHRLYILDFNEVKISLVPFMSTTFVVLMAT